MWFHRLVSAVPHIHEWDMWQLLWGWWLLTIDIHSSLWRHRVLGRSGTLAKADSNTRTLTQWQIGNNCQMKWRKSTHHPAAKNALYSISCCNRNSHWSPATSKPRLDMETPERLGKWEGTRKALSSLNEWFAETFQNSFVDTSISHGGQSIQVSYTSTNIASITFTLHNHICSNTQPIVSDTLPLLQLVHGYLLMYVENWYTCIMNTEIYFQVKQAPARSCDKSTATVATKKTNLSQLLFRKKLCVFTHAYKRKRLLKHFETPPSKRSVLKSHSPDFSNITWDKDVVLQDLQNHPPAP